MVKQLMMTVSVFSILLVNTVNATGSGVGSSKKDLPPPPTHFGNENIDPERAEKIKKALTPPVTRKTPRQIDKERLAEQKRNDILMGYGQKHPTPNVKHYVPMESIRPGRRPDKFR